MSHTPGGPTSPRRPEAPGIPGGPALPSSPLGPGSPVLLSPGGPGEVETNIGAIKS